MLPNIFKWQYILTKGDFEKIFDGIVHKYSFRILIIEVNKQKREH